MSTSCKDMNRLIQTAIEQLTPDMVHVCLLLSATYVKVTRIVENSIASGLGWSLGALVGPSFLAAQSQLKLAVLNAGGGSIVDMFSDQTSMLSVDLYANLGATAGTLVAVSALIAPEMMIEIEVDAIAGSGE